MSNALFLFCGGTLTDLDIDLPKPLLKISSKKTILNIFLKSIPNELWNKVVLIVERKFENDFILELEEVKKNLDFQMNLEVFVCDDNASTLEKFSCVIDQYQFDTATFSYPDIFAERGFWEFKEENSVKIKKVVVKSRFPRISNCLFSEEVRGITLHSSEMPANPHYIYGGAMFAKREIFTDIYNKFKLVEITNSVLEVDFLNFIASENILKSELYSGGWILADGPREYNIVSKKYLLS